MRAVLLTLLGLLCAAVIYGGERVLERRKIPLLIALLVTLALLWVSEP